MAPKELNFITGNKNKLAEVQAILGDVLPLKSQSLDIIEIQGTIEEISIDKCRRAAAMAFRDHICRPLRPATDSCSQLVLTRDSDSKWFLQALGHNGLNDLLVAYEDKSAQAVCTFAYCESPGHDPIIFEGRVMVGSAS
ncbi:MAG: hypothetical protein Q9191_000799 [Dirinaria sp. TL-2023a]